MDMEIGTDPQSPWSVIASEAKQPGSQVKNLDCFVASLLAMTVSAKAAAPRTGSVYFPTLSCSTQNRSVRWAVS